MKYERAIKDILLKLKQNHSERRYEHIISVKDTACEIASRIGVDISKVFMSAILHDFAKYLTLDEMIAECDAYNFEIDDYERNSSSLIHSKVAYIYARKFYSIKDEDILMPILYHTTGRADMSIYEKILFVADYCEPGRDFEYKHDFLSLSFKSLDLAVFEVVRHKIKSIMDRNIILHKNTYDLYNYIVLMV